MPCYYGTFQRDLDAITKAQRQGHGAVANGSLRVKKKRCLDYMYTNFSLTNPKAVSILESRPTFLALVLVENDDLAAHDSLGQ